MRRFPSSVIVAAASTVLLTATAGPASADSPGKLVNRGNGSFGKGDYDKAVEFYEKASVRAPESPVIAFNMGDAFYRKEEFKKAREYFEEAALKARDLKLEAKSWYNMGNCAFREAQRQLDSDMEKALELYRESVSFYLTALEKDKDLADAAHNVEVTRLVIKDLLDRIKKQQEMMQKQQEKMKEVVDSLLSLIAREEDAIGESNELAGDGTRRGKDWKDRLGQLEEDQRSIGKGTGEVLDKLRELFPGQQPPQVSSASSHLDTSLVNQDDALEDLVHEDPGGAGMDQVKASTQMKKALEKLTQGQQQPQQGQDEQQRQQPPEEQQPRDEESRQAAQQPRDETAKNILDEEKENRKKRQQARRSYSPVDKDW